jgi:Gram-negative bacterial TonB protein C-terminal
MNRISEVCLGAFIATVSAGALAQTSATATPTAQPDNNPKAAAASAQTPAPAPQPSSFASALAKSSMRTSTQDNAGAISDDQLKQVLLGKTVYLRGAYLDNTLSFDEHGHLTGHSPQGSYTLSAIKVNKVKVSKRKIELEGDRYAIHFLGALPDQDPKATDKVKITPKKKVVKITIDRDQVEKPKKEKDKKDKGKQKHSAPSTTQVAANSSSTSVLADASTASPAHSSRLLADALDRVFAQSIDENMIAAMPDYWKFYYQAEAANTDYKPSDPAVLHQNMVDRKARLVSTLEPPTNEYAQANAVAGMAWYHAVIGSDGKAQKIVVSRPIGFGLDEGAVETIRKATFEPAMKDGKPVPVALDLVVSFRIYSKRTSEPAVQQATDDSAKPALPGPLSLQHN